MKSSIVALLIATLALVGGAAANRAPRSLIDQLKETLGAKFVKLERLHHKGKHGKKIKVLLKGAPGADAERIIRKILLKHGGPHGSGLHGSGPHAALELEVVLDRGGKKQKQVRRMGLPLGKVFSDRFELAMSPLKGKFELKLGADRVASIEGTLRLGNEKKQVRLRGKIQKKGKFIQERRVRLGNATVRIAWRGSLGSVHSLGDLSDLKGRGKRIIIKMPDSKAGGARKIIMLKSLGKDLGKDLDLEKLLSKGGGAHKVMMKHIERGGARHGAKRRAEIHADGAPRGKLLRHVAEILGYRLKMAPGLDRKKEFSVKVGPAWGKKLWEQTCEQLTARCRVEGNTLHAAPR